MDVRAPEAVRAVNAAIAVRTLRVARSVRVARAAKQCCERYEIPVRSRLWTKTNLITNWSKSF